MSAAHPLVRGAAYLAAAVVIGWSLVNAWYRVTDWSLSDLDAYWNAAMRLREGAPLYPPLPDVSAPDVYRYSPWFAWIWVPLTFLPKAVVGVGWSAVLVAASGAALWPVLRPGATLTAVAVACLLGSFLVWAASVGNVQPLMIAALVHGIDRRSGPLWVGAAASLKAVPILYALVYLGRRQWWRAALSVAIAGLLVLPFLTASLEHYPATSGDSPSPFLELSPVLYGLVVAGLAVVTVLLAARGDRFARLSAAGTALAALPRISLLDLPQLLVGATPARSRVALRHDRTEERSQAVLGQAADGSS